MSDDSEYQELLPNSDLQKRQEYWDVAKGLQKVDGLQTSDYLETVIRDTIDGKYGTAQAASIVESYYKESPAADAATREADIVSARIAAYLEIDDFLMSPVMLLGIHRTLFQGVYADSWVGVT
ncbi:MAG: cell filamentation protein, partial [Coriobacteriia bacterium]|nr:cell filamentation protein [Coriobacteriia bacterium]